MRVKLSMSLGSFDEAKFECVLCLTDICNQLVFFCGHRKRCVLLAIEGVRFQTPRDECFL